MGCHLPHVKCIKQSQASLALATTCLATCQAAASASTTVITLATALTFLLALVVIASAELYVYPSSLAQAPTLQAAAALQ